MASISNVRRELALGLIGFALGAAGLLLPHGAPATAPLPRGDTNLLAPAATATAKPTASVRQS